MRYFTLTYSSCEGHPVQRLFIDICSHLDLHLYGGDDSDAFTHITGPYVTTFVSIDEQSSDWYRHKSGKNIDMEKFLPVLISLQGHPDSGRIWEYLIIEIFNRMGFTTTNHDRNIYRDIYKPTVETIYLLRQVDESALESFNESFAEDIKKK